MFSRFTEHRPFSIIGLFQAFTILFGWILTAGRMKLAGYPKTDFPWNPVSVFLRDWSPLFILVAPVWVVLALYLEDRFSSTTPRWVWLGSGIVLLFSLVALYWYSTAMALGSRARYYVPTFL